AAASKSAEPATVLRVRLPLLPLDPSGPWAYGSGSKSKPTETNPWACVASRFRNSCREPSGSPSASARRTYRMSRREPLTFLLLIFLLRRRRRLLLLPGRTHRLRRFVLRNRALLMARHYRR